MKNPLKQFSVRVTAAIIASILVVVFAGVVLIYQIILSVQFEGLRLRLEGVAQTAALSINSDELLQIPLNKDGINTQPYAHISDQLKRIRAANENLKYIYILKKTDTSNTWRFIVDPDARDNQDKPMQPGDPYDAGRFIGLLNGLDKASSDRKIESDEWGNTVSGYAPIRDEVGRPVAVLGIDVLVDEIVAMKLAVARVTIIILIIGIFLAFAIGWAVSFRVVKPVRQLIDGTKYIAQGHLHHQVTIRGDDEIRELADAFNAMAKSLQNSRGKLLNYFYDTVNTLVKLLEIRDQYTLGHSESVANYADKIARRMGIDHKAAEMFKRVALLHDIGKVGVRDNVLLKPDKLDEEEWRAIKIHPVLGEQILKPILEDGLMLSIIRHHHERYDGKGYPDGLSREQIPLLVAIVTVADSYDAMTSTRAYRKAMSPEVAQEQLRQGRGSQFHPDVVDVFLQILAEEQKRPLV